jgi:H+/Cl- antiporter ClcA
MDATADATATTPELDRGAYVKTLVLAALLGVPVAFAAVLFQTAIHDLIHFVWEYLPDEFGWDEPAWWYVILVPGLAGLLVAGAVRLPGHGGHSPLEGIAMGDVRPVHLVSILPAALATLGLGLVLGPEAPLIAIGLAMGALAVQMVGMGGTAGHLLVLAGAFAAIAALFGGPLVAALLLFEMLAMSGMLPAKMIGAALLPGFVAAGSGGLIFTGVAGWSGLHQQNLALPGIPGYETVRIADLAWCGLVAVVVAFVVVAARRAGFRVARQAAVRPVPALALAGLLVGLLAVLFRAFADRPVDLVLFSGQSEMPMLIAEGSAGVLLLLVVAKSLAYALSLGSGFRGGPVFPAIAIGTALAVAAADLLPGLAVTPAVATGVAAGVAAVLRAPFSAALLSSVLVGSAAVDVAPLSVLGAAVGVLTVVVLPDPKLAGTAEH